MNLIKDLKKMSLIYGQIGTSLPKLTYIYKKIEIKNYIDKSRMRTSGGETNYILTLKHFNF